MKSSLIFLLGIALLVFSICIEAKGGKKKHDKYEGGGPGHGPGGRSRRQHDHQHHHQPGGRSQRHHHNHHQDHGYDHGNDQQYGNNHGHEQGHEHQYDHHNTQTHGNGHEGYGHVASGYDNGHRHRRDAIVNGTDTTTEATNQSATLEPGTCTKLVSVTVTFAQSFQKSRKVPAIVKCGWLHLAKCKVYRLEYEVAYRQATRVQYAIFKKCCPGFMEVNGVCELIGGRTTPPPITTPTTPSATTTPIMTTTADIPDDYKMVMDDKIQKLVTAIIIILLILFAGCCLGACLVYVCKCCKGKKGSYV